jgi:hypothetical protein
MKKTMYLFGLLSSVGVTVGAIFKLQHWAYASLILLVGVLFGMFSLTLLFVSFYKQEVVKRFSDKLIYLTSALGILMLVLGLFFYLNHWPYSTIIFILGILIFDLGFLPLMFFKIYRRSVS